MQERKKPKAFNIYCDTYEHVELLNMEQRGELLTALYEYANSGKRPDFKSEGLRMAFSFLRSQMDRDFAKYEAICEKNKSIARKRKTHQPSPSVTTGNQYKEEEKEKEKEENKEEDKYKEKENASAVADAEVAADVLSLYNFICDSLPAVQELTEDELRLVRMSPQVDFREYFTKVQRSDFLTGRSGKWNGCTLKWLLRPDTIAKVMNGFYDDRPKPQPPKRDTSYDIREIEKIDTLDWI